MPRITRGDCREVMQTFEENSIDAVITDPPYGLSFMGKEWDHGIPGTSFWEETLRVCKPGAHMCAFGGTRTHHRLMVAIEDAGWEIRDCLMWVYGSGFPKSLDISKAIDKAAGAEREVIGKSNRHGGGIVGAGSSYEVSPEIPYITAPTTPAAIQWTGWGTALKPAWEPIILCRKPLVGTVSENVQKWGTGGLNIDACRIEVPKTDNWYNSNYPHKTVGYDASGYKIDYKRGSMSNEKGRFPANLIHDGSEEVLVLLENKSSGHGHFPKHPKSTNNGIYGKFKPSTQEEKQMIDNGNFSAARFFYSAKADPQERNKWLNGTCSVKLNVFKNNKLVWKGANIELVALLQKVTSGLMVKWSIGESGGGIMGRCPVGSLSTTLTEIKKITPSKILPLLTPSLINAFILAVNLEMGNGGNLAESVDRLNRLKQITIPDLPPELARGVNSVVSQMLSTISAAGNWKPDRNIHNTVKPVDLLRYLCRLITPPKGVILDPFAGSGSTGVAAFEEGFDYTLIEIEEEYYNIAKIRNAQTRLP